MATFTVEDLKGWYVKYNYLYFKGQLKQCPIYINHTKRALGLFHVVNRWTDECYIKISNYLDRPIRDVQNTLIHEMIHQWQWVNYGRCDHGYTFKQKAKEINKDGWCIKRTNSTEGCFANYVAPNKVYQICVFKRNGKYCKSVLASNKVDYFKTWVPSIEGISGLYFGTSTDPSFDKYTCSRTRLTWHCITEDEYNTLVAKITRLASAV